MLTPELLAVVLAVFGAGLAIGLGAIGSAIGEGFIAMRAMAALGRQPKAAGQILRTMLIGQAVTETAAIFALVIALLLIFQSPDAGMTWVKSLTYGAAGLAIGFGTIGAGLGAGLPGGAACDGIAKNPKNTDVLSLHMLIAQAVTQTATIFSLTVALILILITPESTLTAAASVLGAGLAIGFGAIGPGLGDGLVAYNANKALARNPKHMALVTRTMLIGQAVTETTDIYSMVVALMLIFVA